MTTDSDSGLRECPLLEKIRATEKKLMQPTIYVTVQFVVAVCDTCPNRSPLQSGCMSHWNHGPEQGQCNERKER